MVDCSIILSVPALSPSPSPSPVVGGWYIAMGQYSFLCEGAVVNSLDAVDIEEDVLVRVQVECVREEVNNREKQEKDRTKRQTTNAQAHIIDGMKMD